jgi:hypothetical protein
MMQFTIIRMAFATKLREINRIFLDTSRPQAFFRKGLFQDMMVFGFQDYVELALSRICGIPF